MPLNIFCCFCLLFDQKKMTEATLLTIYCWICTKTRLNVFNQHCLMFVILKKRLFCRRFCLVVVHIFWTSSLPLMDLPPLRLGSLFHHLKLRFWTCVSFSRCSSTAAVLAWPDLIATDYPQCRSSSVALFLRVSPECIHHFCFRSSSSDKKL